GLPARVLPVLEDRWRCVGNVRAAPAEALDAAARTGNAGGDATAAVALKLFRDRLGDRVHGARAVDFDRRSARRRVDAETQCEQGAESDDFDVHGNAPWIIRRNERAGSGCRTSSPRRMTLT